MRCLLYFFVYQIIINNTWVTSIYLTFDSGLSSDDCDALRAQDNAIKISPPLQYNIL